MKFNLVILFICFSNIALSAISDCSQLTTKCEFYLCVETQKSCGNRGYLKSFGHKFCAKFSKSKDNNYFSAQTENWIEETKSCLTEAIDSLDPKLKCQDFKRQAFKQHKYCYVSSGFCSLPKKEKKKIIKTIGFTLLKPRVLATAINVLKACKQSKF